MCVLIMLIDLLNFAAICASPCGHFIYSFSCDLYCYIVLLQLVSIEVLVAHFGLPVMPFANVINSSIQATRSLIPYCIETGPHNPEEKNEKCFFSGERRG